MYAVYACMLLPAVNGYEGTGRSLSLKLIQQLREQASGAGAAAAKGGSSSSKGLAAATGSGGAVGRTFREVTLEEPIRCDKGVDSAPNVTFDATFLVHGCG